VSQQLPGWRFHHQLIVNEIDQLVPLPPYQPEGQDGSIRCGALEEGIAATAK
jgi:hypothetical protein